MPITPGSRIGPYAIVSSLGAGGMGEVYKARDTRLNRDVAIKVLPPSFASDDERLRRFMIEAQSAGALNHPNILVVHDVGAEHGTPYVVSELLEGRTLREALASGALPPRKAIDYAIQAANGLAAAHDKGIVHRDLKPDNIFITKDGRLKLLDFGLAKLAVPDVAAVGVTVAPTLDPATTPGMVLGTVGYMSPEQLRGEDVDARSDIFSLGAVIYEMFAGARAFKGNTAVETMSAILKEDPADLTAAASGISPAIDRVVRRCLEKHRDERFQSARDVTFALEAVSNSSSASGKMEAVPAPALPRRRATRAVASAAIVTAIVAGGLGYAAARRVAPAPPAQPRIRQLTFRSGTVRAARFTPDPKTVVYAAAWEGKPLQLFSARQDSSESSAINLPPATLLAMSASGEMAIALKPDSQIFFVAGTLAKAPLAGGAAREMLEGVVDADFGPDGNQLAAIRRQGSNFEVQYPIGTALLTAPYWLSNVRVSSDGAQVAFISHPIGGDEGNVEIVDAKKQRRTLSSGWLSIQGLAWAPGGRELWFTATKTGGLRAIWAVTTSGAERLVYRAPQRLTLEDIAADGRVLLTGTTMRSEVLFGSLHAKTERKLSWFDWATQLSLSPDATTIAFTESGEGAGDRYGVYVRPTDGSPAVRLGDGVAGAISPDLKWVAGLTQDGHTFSVFPTGPGDVRHPNIAPIDNIEGVAIRWFADSRRLVVVGSEKGHQHRAWAVPMAGGAPKPLTPEGTAGVQVSPDSKWIVIVRDDRRLLFSLETGATVDVGIKPDETIVGWTADSRAVIAASRALPITATRVDIASKQRTPLGTIAPTDPDGITSLGGVTFAADADHYLYGYARFLSELFVVDGLK